MTTSPIKNTQLSAVGEQQLGSPRSPGRLRKLQSAHQLSSQYVNASGPSLISQQRQQQQQQQRKATTPLTPPVPPIPPQHSPQRQTRTRSNSDANLSNVVKPIDSPSKLAVPKKTAVQKDAKYELEALIRHGPRNDVPLALQNLRHWILCDGMNADSDGMVLTIYVQRASKLTSAVVSIEDLRLAHPPQYSAHQNRRIPRPYETRSVTCTR